MKNVTFDVHIDAVAESEVLIINSSIFAQLSEQNVYVENFAYKVTIDRFSGVMWAMEQILFMSFDKRLATFLLDESAKNNSDTIQTYPRANSKIHGERARGCFPYGQIF